MESLLKEKDEEIALLRLSVQDKQEEQGIQEDVPQEGSAIQQPARMGAAKQHHGEGGGPKRKSWNDLKNQQKRRSTADIKVQVEALSEERDTEPYKIAAHLIHRFVRS